MNFAPSATLDDILEHLVVMMYSPSESQVSPYRAHLFNLGSGQIGISQSGEREFADWILRGNGSDITYTLSDNTGQNGHLIYSMEWV